MLKYKVKNIANNVYKLNSEISKFDLISKNKFSMKLNDDLSDYIKNEVMKKDLVTPTSKRTIINLITMLVKYINKLIYNNDEIKKKYTNSNFIPDKHVKIIYDIIYLVFKHYPNKFFELEKYKISKVRKYFIYKIKLRNLNHTNDNEYFHVMDIKYLIFDYSEYEENNLLYLYPIQSLDTLKITIKENFKILDPITNQKKSISLNKSAKSHSAKSSRSSRSSKSSKSL